MAANPESTRPAPPPEEDQNSSGETHAKLVDAGDERVGDERVGDERVGDELAKGLETSQGPKSPEDEGVDREGSKSPGEKRQSTTVNSPKMHSSSRQMSKGDADEWLQDDRMQNNEDTRPEGNTSLPNSKS